MPKSKSSTNAPADSSTGLVPPADGRAERARADALFRSAAECCRQHARYARLVQYGAALAEQQVACRTVRLNDELLEEMMNAFAKVLQRTQRHGGDGWWHPASLLLLASREYLCRHDGCDRTLRGFDSQSVTKLNEFATEYELEASSLLALQRAVDDYRRVRPEAELKNVAAWPAA